MAAKGLKEHTYRATLPNGEVITRTTKRIYTHVVVAKSEDAPRAEPTWGALGWCGREDLAVILARKNQTWRVRDRETGKITLIQPEILILPVDNPRASEGE